MTALEIIALRERFPEWDFEWDGEYIIAKNRMHNTSYMYSVRSNLSFAIVGGGGLRRGLAAFMERLASE